MAFHARTTDTTAASAEQPAQRPVRDGRIVSPEEATAIDDRRALLSRIDLCRAEMKRQFALVNEGSAIGGHLKTLAEMFGHSLAAVDGDNGQTAIEFGYLVADIMGVMAARLGCLEDQGRASIDHCEAQVA